MAAWGTVVCVITRFGCVVTVPFIRMIYLLILATLIKWHLEIDIVGTIRGMMPHPKLWFYG